MPLTLAKVSAVDVAVDILVKTIAVIEVIDKVSSVLISVRFCQHARVHLIVLKLTQKDVAIAEVELSLAFDLTINPITFVCIACCFIA